ncbi:MAG: hypothetical protein UT10_C0030G0009 [Candidatus Woesebacteria bacterium GW2011_GWB1_38_8b]|uniref:Uncharacterized protein n=1 Tax=Candidatus Woesebacteria bacterium GW2011_GWB1_38_8b TaxID=1618571 RepID=A0A0G0NK89_9BACT|nr:MAG: hypothetical protein UT10_C0030G0009 [Candidatus Woesebacteria bacterium GW2011_GWB1_38_8b]
MKRAGTDYIKNRIKGYLENKTIVEKKLHIPANYQAVAIKSKNYLQANWHQQIGIKTKSRYSDKCFSQVKKVFYLI